MAKHRFKVPNLVSGRELMRLTGVSRNTLVNMLRDGRIKPAMNGGTQKRPLWLYSPDTVKDVLDAMGRGEQLMTVSHACRYLNISRQTWYNWFEKHPIPAQTIDGLEYKLYQRVDIDDMALANGHLPLHIAIHANDKDPEYGVDWGDWEGDDADADV